MIAILRKYAHSIEFIDMFNCRINNCEPTVYYVGQYKPIQGNIGGVSDNPKAA
jgi:hypothetical protein